VRPCVINKIKTKDLTWSIVQIVEHLKHEALGSIPSAKTKTKTKKHPKLKASQIDWIKRRREGKET
jgi:hypothetical protein